VEKQIEDGNNLRSGSHLSSLALEASNSLLSPLGSHLELGWKEIVSIDSSMFDSSKSSLGGLVPRWAIGVASPRGAGKLVCKLLIAKGAIKKGKGSWIPGAFIPLQQQLTSGDERIVVMMFVSG